MNPFAGSWTYRSFFNLPKVDKFEDLRFAEAELTLVETERQDLLTGRLTFGAAYLEMIAFATAEGVRNDVRMRATGVKGTPTEGWVYDYVGHLAANWEHGDAQRPAIVGTVIRSAYHEPGRSAGVSASFIAVHRSVPPPVYCLPENVRSHFAGRLHRLHHAVWHGIRNTWDLMDEPKRTAVRNLDWDAPRPARAYGPDRQFKASHIMNGSGEDFLFFHRQMIATYKTLMAEAGQTHINWTTVPEPGASEVNDVPAVWPIAGESGFERRLISLKSDVYYWTRMRWWDQEYKNPAYLATLTLGQFGSILEFSVHNDMHMRWSAAPRDPETNTILLSGRPQHDFSTKWESPKYDWLGEFYASHVNPFFWRLHGWIDDRIEDWFLAHEARQSGEVKRVTKGGVSWFETSKWVQVDKPWVWPESLGGHEDGHGGNGHDHHSGHNGSHDDLNAKRLASLEAIAGVLYPPPAPSAQMLTEGQGIDAALTRALSTVIGLNGG
jgi:hypothetical protein